VTIKSSGTGTIVVKVTYNDGGTITPVATLTVEVNAACPTVGYSAAKSSVSLSTVATAITSQNTGGDSAGAGSRLYSQLAYIPLWLADQYGTGIVDTGNYLEVSATNGAYVKFDGTPVATSDVTTSTIKDAVVNVANGPSGTYKPVTTTVTIKANGTVIGTKTITFTGVAASVTLSELPTVLGTGATKTIKYIVKDAAGNQIAESAEAGSASTSVNGAGFTFGTASTDTVAGTAIVVTDMQGAFMSDGPVAVNGSGALTAASSTTDRLIGSFDGVEYTDSSGRRSVSKWISYEALTASTQIIFWIFSDPQLVYEIQAVGSIASTAIGKGFNFSAASGYTPLSGIAIGNGGAGFSTCALNNTAVTASTQGQVKCVGLGREVAYPTGELNAWGDTNTIVQVQIANSQLVAPSIAVA
jgi:hypothetical protein